MSYKKDAKYLSKPHLFKVGAVLKRGEKWTYFLMDYGML